MHEKPEYPEPDSCGCQFQIDVSPGSIGSAPSVAVVMAAMVSADVKT
jgi:hypothetical protein